MDRKISHEHIFFKSGDIVLEGVLSLPNKNLKSPGAVICHPHPLYGGDMNNNVVMGVKKTLESEGFAVLRFNFRGVTLSGGRYDGGNGEVDDAVAAVHFLSAHPAVDRDRLFLAGYSFGAWVGFRAALTLDNLRAVGGIAPPCGLYDFTFLQDCRVPVLTVAGADDAMCEQKELEKVFDKIPLLKKNVVLPHADHFFSGREGEVGEALKKFIKCL